MELAMKAQLNSDRDEEKFKIMSSIFERVKQSASQQ